MKKIFNKLCILFILTTIMTSCSKTDMVQDNDMQEKYDTSSTSQHNPNFEEFVEEKNDTNFPAQTNPSIKKFENGYSDFGFGLDIDSEQDYSNIIAYTENENYFSDFEKIIITVENQNVGKGFYLYIVPAIERKTDNDWVRLNYNPEAYLLGDDNWAFCGIDGQKEIKYSSCVFIWSENLKDKWNEGEYRAVIFVGKETIYAPFSIIKK